jgi:hypothetical protein
MRKTAVILVAVAGCTTQPFEVAGMREAQASEVANCAQIGRVKGVPGLYGPLAKLGQKDARRAAKERALEEGGNTIVFDLLPDDAIVTEFPATVYRC